MAERDRCAPQVTGFAADVQKILDTYPRAEDIMEAEELDAAGMPEVPIHMGRYWVHRTGTWHEMVMVEAPTPKAAMKLAPEIPAHVWEASRILTEDRPRRKTPYYLGGVSLSDTREPWRPEDPAEVHRRRAAALKAVEEKKTRNREALAQKDGYTEVELMARVLHAHQFPWFGLDDTDAAGDPFWRRLIPRAQEIIEAVYGAPTLTEEQVNRVLFRYDTIDAYTVRDATKDLNATLADVRAKA